MRLMGRNEDRQDHVDALFRQSFDESGARVRAMLSTCIDRGGTPYVWVDPALLHARERAFLTSCQCDGFSPRLLWISDGKLVTSDRPGSEVLPCTPRGADCVFVLGCFDTEYYVRCCLYEVDSEAMVCSVDDMMFGPVARQEPCDAIVEGSGRFATDSVCALVILHHPDEDVVDHVMSYARSVRTVYVYDNSPACDLALRRRLEDLGCVEYRFGGGANHGICEPVNAIAAEARRDGFVWMITFDQDSVAAPHMVERMLAAAEGICTNDVRLLAPMIRFSSDPLDPHVRMPAVSGLSFTIQSGLMHRLDLFEEGIVYDERLFIDEVDNEYCVRVRAAGYSIAQVNDAILWHQVSDGRSLRDKYSALRYYYRYRNLLYAAERYEAVDPLYSGHCLNTLGDIEAFLESDVVEVGAKGTAMLLALYHRMQGRWPTYDVAVRELDQMLA